MEHPGIRIDRLPPVESPVFIIGFDGWGNALQVATDTVGYLVDRLGPSAGEAARTDELKPGRRRAEPALRH